MGNKNKGKINFRFQFECRCGENNARNFLLTPCDGHAFKLLCCRCERIYIVQIIAKEVCIQFNNSRELGTGNG